MANIYKVHFYAHYYEHFVEIVADSKKDARIITAHSHGVSTKNIKEIECIDNNFHGEYYMKDEKRHI